MPPAGVRMLPVGQRYAPSSSTGLQKADDQAQRMLSKGQSMVELPGGQEKEEKSREKRALEVSPQE